MTYALELKVNSAEKEVGLLLKNASQLDRTQVLNLLASLFQVEVKEVQLSVFQQEKKSEKQPVIPQKVNRETAVESKPIDKPSVSRKLPIIDLNRSEMVSVGEKIQAAIQQNGAEPEFYKTGIKIDEDGTKRYKCRYTCKCGKKGNHYIPLKTEKVTCFDCGEPLKVSLAVGEVDAHGVPVRDDFGNYFTAG
jgi:hypothetical protein